MFFNINSRIKNQIKLFERGLKTDIENMLTICVEFSLRSLVSVERGGGLTHDNGICCAKDLRNLPKV